MQFAVTGTKWCHLSWTTFRRRQLFKIAATAQFCERAIRDRCAHSGMRLDSIAVTADRVHVLVQVDAGRTRIELLAAIKSTARAALHRQRALPRWCWRVWAPGGWCAVLSNANALWAVRKHINTLSQLRYPGRLPGNALRSRIVIPDGSIR